MAFPSGGVLSAWPESISDRISRSSKMRWAASSARFDVEELRAISCVTACRAASVCSGVGPASLAWGRAVTLSSGIFSVLMANGMPVPPRIMNGVLPALNCAVQRLSASAIPRGMNVTLRRLARRLSLVIASDIPRWRLA